MEMMSISDVVLGTRRTWHEYNKENVLMQGSLQEN